MLICKFCLGMFCSLQYFSISVDSSLVDAALDIDVLYKMILTYVRALPNLSSDESKYLKILSKELGFYTLILACF